jgi:hypothetical protein
VIHPPDCECTTSLGCRLRRENSVQLNAGAAITKRKGRPQSNARYNGWERGIAGEHRPGGTFMPYLDPKTSSPMGVKQASEQRHKIAEVRQRQKQRAIDLGGSH